MDIKTTPVEELAMGAIKERLNDALADVIANIKDVNTKSSIVREINLKLKIVPEQDREACKYEIHCSSKLAPVREVGGIMYVGVKDGEPVAYERNPDQGTLEFAKPDEVINAN